ncbi:hypothetical protein P3T36_002984 [Kitasatospora sp. MAP12-15]|uniref:hypothetical protein n=1 Tax=unclassified Kitasatospora TaxID=2633591 RepID=UPI0024746ED8|nr:hypothetical protein [Kitasatospora sp. MAP12-44]MDH6108853.1 hypothetical protein [Kitasatospora sp. MAP12-44]
MSANNLVSVKGGKVHAPWGAGLGANFPSCRELSQHSGSVEYKSTGKPVDCKSCLKGLVPSGIDTTAVEKKIEGETPETAVAGEEEMPKAENLAPAVYRVLHFEHLAETHALSNVSPGRSGVPHLLPKGSETSVCGKNAPYVQRPITPGDDTKICQACGKKAPGRPFPTREVLATIPGLNYTPKSKEADMPTKDETVTETTVETPAETESAEAEIPAAILSDLRSEEFEKKLAALTPAQREKAEQIIANMEVMIRKAVAGDDVKSFASDTEKLIGKAATGVRVQLRAALKKAAAAKAPETAPAVIEGTVTLASEQVPGWQKIEGMKTLVDRNTSAIAARYAAVKETAKLARELADRVIEQRTLVSLPTGEPDLKGRRQESRDSFSATFDESAEEIIANAKATAAASGRAFTEDEEAEIRRDLAGLKKSTQNQITNNAMPTYVRALDHSPEEAAKYAKILEANPELSAAEAVHKFYDFKWSLNVELTSGTGPVAVGSGDEEPEDGDGADGGQEDESDESAEAPEFVALTQATKAIDKIDLKKAEKRRTHKLTKEAREALAKELAELADKANRLRLILETPETES